MKLAVVCFLLSFLDFAIQKHLVTSAVQLLDLQRDFVIGIVELDTEHTTECPNPQELLLASTTEQNVVPLLGDHCKTILPNTAGTLFLL